MEPVNCLWSPRLAALAASASLVLGINALATASELVDLQPLTERILMLHFNDGRVQHHQRGEPRSAEKVFTDPLDVVAAARPESYNVTSADDPAYRQKRFPLSVGRKSKGTDYAWFVDKWENGRAVNNRPDHTKEHWIYGPRGLGRSALPSGRDEHRGAGLQRPDALPHVEDECRDLP